MVRNQSLLTSAATKIASLMQTMLAQFYQLTRRWQAG
jgi:hypothetical protein